MLELLSAILFLFAITTAGYSDHTFSKRAYQSETALGKSDHQASENVVHDFDLNKTPPRESNESPGHDSPVHEMKRGPNNKVQKSKQGRPQKHATEAERKAAIRQYRKKYRKKFTKVGIEKAKQTLKGGQLQKFLCVAKNYHVSAKTRQRRFKIRKASDQMLKESQRAALRAFRFEAKMKQEDPKND